jgi:hypothetical protein
VTRSWVSGETWNYFPLVAFEVLAKPFPEQIIFVIIVTALRTLSNNLAQAV